MYLPYRGTREYQHQQRGCVRGTNEPDQRPAGPENKRLELLCAFEDMLDLQQDAEFGRVEGEAVENLYGVDVLRWS